MKKRLFLILMFIILLSCNKVYAYKQYQRGDEITYREEKYYVIEKSSKSINYIVALKAELLSKDVINLYSTDYTSVDGEYPYYTSSTCNDNEMSGCKVDYNVSNVKKIIDEWSNDFKNDLVVVNGYRARILNEEDLLHGLGYKKEVTDSSINYSSVYYLTPSWVQIEDKKYWTSVSSDDNSVLALTNRAPNVNSKYYIRPVINLNKCLLNDSDVKCTKKQNNDNSLYDDYQIGDNITYNDELYHVIENSDYNTNYITLLKDTPLTLSEIEEYGKDINGTYFINEYINDKKIEEFDLSGTKYGSISYLSRNMYCTNILNSGVPDYKLMWNCINEYDSSNVRRVLNNWSKSFTNDLVKVGDYKVRLLNSDDLIYNLNYDYNSSNPDISYDWLINSQYNYWTMIPYNNEGYKYNLVYLMSKDGKKTDSILNKNAIRPVIYLNKCIVEKNNPNCSKYYEKNLKCSDEKKMAYKDFKVGDEVTYRNEKYYVIENSTDNQNYVTLLKDKMLTLDDLDSYRDEIMNNMKLSNNIGYINYSCDDENNCSTDYNTSIVKKIIDNWVEMELSEDDLIEVDGYKARLLSKSDLIDNLGYTLSENGTTFYLNEQPNIFPNFLYFWTMISLKDGEIYVSSINRKVSDYNAVLPVINVKKSIFNNENYELGQKLYYKNEAYYIISRDTESKNYITLLKEKPLNYGQVAMYYSDDLFFATPYYISDTCNSSDNMSGCTTNFDVSEVKKIMDIWSEKFSKDLVSVNGNKTRLITQYDLIYSLNYDMDNYFTTSYLYCKSSDTPNWVYNRKIPYWSMETYEDSNYLVYQNMANGCLDTYTMNNINEKPYQISTIRPIINLNKCAIGGCYEIEKCSEESEVVVANTLKHISKILFIICGIIIVLGGTFISYNYIMSRKERKNIK